MAGTINTYDIGDAITLSGDFTLSGTATAPTAVVLRLKHPNGSAGTVAASATATGSYSGTVTAGTAGAHFYRFEGTGTVQAAGERRFEVRRSEFS